MSAKFAAWLRVTPAPSTLAESSAIYQALNKYGRISVFARATEQEKGLVKSQDKTSRLYYTVFPHEPPSLRMTFDVPVYHGLPSARDEDPFNVRGLQNRKPMPAPKTFTCAIERAHQDDAGLQERKMVKENPFHGHFQVDKNSWLQDVLVETGAPPGIDKGLSFTVHDRDAKDHSFMEEDNTGSERPAKTSKINMSSLLDMWCEATGVEKQKKTKSR